MTAWVYLEDRLGNHMPDVHPDARVEVSLRGGRHLIKPAKFLSWRNCGQGSDILSWRYAEPQEKTIQEEFQDYVKTATSEPLANSKQIAGTHYKDMGVEPWNVIDTWPLEQRIGAYRAGALKYLMRMGSKDERLQEIEKCGHYVEKLIETLKEVK